MMNTDTVGDAITLKCVPNWGLNKSERVFAVFRQILLKIGREFCAFYFLVVFFMCSKGRDCK